MNMLVELILESQKGLVFWRLDESSEQYALYRGWKSVKASKGVNRLIVQLMHLRCKSRWEDVGQRQEFILAEEIDEEGGTNDCPDHTGGRGRKVWVRVEVTVRM